MPLSPAVVLHCVDAARERTAARQAAAPGYLNSRVGGRR
jgi:hypothetical protein